MEKQILVVAAVGGSQIDHASALTRNTSKQEYVVVMATPCQKLEARSSRSADYIHDNAKPHDAVYVSNALHELQEGYAYRILVYFNTPYSPWLNTIEFVWHRIWILVEQYTKDLAPPQDGGVASLYLHLMADLV
jgi:hypothetical protein